MMEGRIDSDRGRGGLRGTGGRHQMMANRRICADKKRSQNERMCNEGRRGKKEKSERSAGERKRWPSSIAMHKKKTE
jgi:hypothetical protein